MSQTTESAADPEAATEQPKTKRPIGRVKVVALGGLASVIIMAIPLNNSVPAHVAAWIVGAFYVAIADAVVTMLAGV